MSISIIIPCYNQSEFLLEAINSCINQSKKADEIIVLLMDKRSWELKEYLESLNIICIVSPQLSLTKARNMLIANTKSTYIIPLDADDYLPLNFIEETSKIDSDIVYVDSRVLGNGMDIITRTPDIVQKRHFTSKHPVIRTTALFKKTVWFDIGGYNEDFTYGHECWEFWYRAFFLGKSFKKCHTTYYIYKQYPTNGRAYIARDNFQIIRKQLKELYPGDFEVISRRNIPPKERKNFANLK